ncbi:MAG TPA: class I SAM-dependent methyltransferase [Thiotrichales bacterium]|nr:class I SAM-dependent methyltransferase [Thiotrichales bacterium]
MDSLNFYRAFEDRHRGSRELIKSRLEQYSPFLELLILNFDKCSALDIGCGRGEWLELLSEKGFTPHGVDLDSGMLAACLERGFDVKKADGIKYLESFESNSIHLISAFHVVEHIGFEQLQNLVNQALRVLAPGGILILETPNPENIVVASANFYLDPTHIKPIPPLLLSFVTEFAGFKHNKIVRLQESVELREKQNISLSELLFGVSPDYSVVAQKPIDNESELRMVSIFEQDFGLSLSELSARLDNRLVSIEAKASEAEAKASEAEAKASEAEAKASEAEAKASEAEARTHDALHHYHLVVNSNSWKMTKPLRLFGKAVRWFFRGSYHWLTFSPTSRPRRVLKQKLIDLKHYINARPSMKYKLMTILNNFPSLKAILRRLGLNSSLSFNNSGSNIQNSVTESSGLSPRATQIYAQLKQAIENQKNKS